MKSCNSGHAHSNSITPVALGIVEIFNIGSATEDPISALRACSDEFPLEIMERLARRPERVVLLQCTCLLGCDGSCDCSSQLSTHTSPGATPTENPSSEQPFLPSSSPACSCKGYPRLTSDIMSCFRGPSGLKSDEEGGASCGGGGSSSSPPPPSPTLTSPTTGMSTLLDDHRSISGQAFSQLSNQWSIGLRRVSLWETYFTWGRSPWFDALESFNELLSSKDFLPSRFRSMFYMELSNYIILNVARTKSFGALKSYLPRDSEEVAAFLQSKNPLKNFLGNLHKLKTLIDQDSEGLRTAAFCIDLADLTRRKIISFRGAKLKKIQTLREAIIFATLTGGFYPPKDTTRSGKVGGGGEVSGGGVSGGGGIQRGHPLRSTIRRSGSQKSASGGGANAGGGLRGSFSLRSAGSGLSGILRGDSLRSGILRRDSMKKASKNLNPEGSGIQRSASLRSTSAVARAPEERSVQKESGIQRSDSVTGPSGSGIKEESQIERSDSLTRPSGSGIQNESGIQRRDSSGGASDGDDIYCEVSGTELKTFLRNMNQSGPGDHDSIISDGLYDVSSALCPRFELEEMRYSELTKGSGGGGGGGGEDEVLDRRYREIEYRDLGPVTSKVSTDPLYYLDRMEDVYHFRKSSSKAWRRLLKPHPYLLKELERPREFDCLHKSDLIDDLELALHAQKYFEELPEDPGMTGVRKMISSSLLKGFSGVNQLRNPFAKFLRCPPNENHELLNIHRANALVEEKIHEAFQMNLADEKELASVEASFKNLKCIHTPNSDRGYPKDEQESQIAMTAYRGILNDIEYLKFKQLAQNRTHQDLLSGSTDLARHVLISNEGAEVLHH